MLPAFVTAMQDPGFYPHRPAEVGLVQTHISYVFLAGDEVYKVKKPVRFSFLDFSEVGLRRHFCHEEVRLNRRLAADVYRGVVAICAADGGFRLAAEEDAGAVEYAVHMRRLPHERMLDQLLRRGAATPAMLDRLVERLVSFHRHAEAGRDVAAYGDPAAIAGIIEDNLAGVRPFRGETIDVDDDAAIAEFFSGFLRWADALLRRRQAEGRIREGHGDLHAEHVCFADGLAIFDCIEFNRAFRCCDVASEIAFLAMDLEYRGAPDLARHFATAYAGAADDADLLTLLPFYQCHRAYVRGKVASLKSAEPEVEAAERAAAHDDARRHFRLAYRYTWAYRPSLVMMSGLSGTGKSTIARALHERTGFTHISSDRVRKELAGVPPGARPSAHAVALYTPEMNARTYAAMLARAREELRAGRGAIVDATFPRRAEREQARALARECSVPVILIACRCDEDEVRRRLARRFAASEDPSDADWNVYVEQRSRYEPVEPTEEGEPLIADTTAGAAAAAVAVERALRSRINQPWGGGRRGPTTATPGG